MITKEHASLRCSRPTSRAVLPVRDVAVFPAETLRGDYGRIWPQAAQSPAVSSDDIHQPVDRVWPNDYITEQRAQVQVKGAGSL